MGSKFTTKRCLTVYFLGSHSSSRNSTFLIAERGKKSLPCFVMSCQSSICEKALHLCDGLKMAQWWRWCAGGDEDFVATAVDSWPGRRLVSLQMLRTHTGFPCLPLLPPPLAARLSIAPSNTWEVQRPGGIF